MRTLHAPKQSSVLKNGRIWDCAEKQIVIDLWLRACSLEQIRDAVNTHMLGRGISHQTSIYGVIEKLEALGCVSPWDAADMTEGYKKYCLKIYQKNRYAAIGNVSPEMRDMILARDGHACLACGTVSDLTIDHVEPYRAGGKTVADNLQTLCRACNSRKSAKTLDARHSCETRTLNRRTIISGGPPPEIKIPVNAPCPCGKGKKYKRCCMSGGFV